MAANILNHHVFQKAGLILYQNRIFSGPLNSLAALEACITSLYLPGGNTFIAYSIISRTILPVGIQAFKPVTDAAFTFGIIIYNTGFNTDIILKITER